MKHDYISSVWMEPSASSVFRWSWSSRSLSTSSRGVRWGATRGKHRSRWWQLKYFVILTPISGKIPILTIWYFSIGLKLKPASVDFLKENPFPHLPVPYIFGTRGRLVGIYIYRELEDQGLVHKVSWVSDRIPWTKKNQWVEWVEMGGGGQWMKKDGG